MSIMAGILTIISVMAVVKAHEQGAYGDLWSLLWAILLGWNIHSLLSML
jgi:hypothetical protein